MWLKEVNFPLLFYPARKWQIPDSNRYVGTHISRRPGNTKKNDLERMSTKIKGKISKNDT